MVYTDNEFRKLSVEEIKLWTDLNILGSKNDTDGTITYLNDKYNLS